MGGLWRASVMAALAVVMFATEVSSTRWTVGGRYGWSPVPQANSTLWAENIHFYKDDWLYFVYDRNQQNVLEVNKTDYETCNSDHPLHNWTTGAGRDVVPLNVTRHYYFISGKGFCFSGMKLAIKVENAPPPPKSSPVKSGAAKSTYRGQYILPAVFAVGVAWDAFVRFW